MTTLIDYKEEKLSEIESLADEIIYTRLRVVEASQLADEIKKETDQGLSLPYPDMALFYGRQRAIIRGLTQSDIMYFDFPSNSEWNTEKKFTLPSKTQFGYVFVDNEGNDSIINDPSLYYLTRKKSDKTLSTNEKDSDAFIYPSILDDFKQQAVVLDEEKQTYEIMLKFPATPGTLKVYYNDAEIGKDNGRGNIKGESLRNSTVNYDEKVVLYFKDKLDGGSIIKLVYNTYTGVDNFEKEYEQINFTLSQKKNFGQALDLMILGNGVISYPPDLLDTMKLRRKSDHNVAGIVQVVCEGLRINTNWYSLTEDPEDYLRITHDQFKTLLGYLNPDISNDLTKSANPEITSNGREDGGTYPDIEANPFFPWTDGTYVDSPPYTGNYVHLEESIPKWSVHSDIKWQYGTAPASLGETAQEDPDSFLEALNEIDTFSGAGNNPIPDDVGSSTVEGYSYEMNGNYVWRYDWQDNTGVPFDKVSVGEYPCYYNDIQHLKEDHLTHLQTQCGLIATLGNTVNTIDTDRQTGDTDFIADTATYLVYLDAFLAYHDAFNPITGRPTYDTSEMTTLKAVNSVYLSEFNSRVTDLDTVIGTATTSGYSKIIYDSCSMAVHMDIGYLRDVIDELNSIQSLYEMIVNNQGLYALLP